VAQSAVARPEVPGRGSFRAFVLRLTEAGRGSFRAFPAAADGGGALRNAL